MYSGAGRSARISKSREIGPATARRVGPPGPRGIDPGAGAPVARVEVGSVDDHPPTQPLEALRFGEDGRFALKVANDRATRAQAYRLLYALYLEKGIARSDPTGMTYSLWDAVPETTTLYVEYDDRMVAVLTVYQDSPLGLPADEQYEAELTRMRDSGKRLCELGALGVARDFPSSKNIVPRLMEASFLLANDIRIRTHAVVECHPSHAHLYRDLLNFEQVGAEGSLERVNEAPVVLMGVELSEFERRHRAGIRGAAWSSGAFTNGPRARAGRRAMDRDLKRMLQPMSEEELRYFFIESKPLLEGATADQRRYLRSRYPEYDLGRAPATDPAGAEESMSANGSP